MSRSCFVANWKMNKTVAETLAYLSTFQKQFSDLTQYNVEIIIAPPHTALFSAGQLIKELRLPIALATQNFYCGSDGPYTGEISSRMLCETGCQYVIIGHSERRIHFGEKDAVLSKKVDSAIEAGLIPILCVGESAQERDEGRTLEVVTRQVREGCGRNIGTLQAIIAYEPIWAIGTGRTPVPSEVDQVHQAIAEVFEREETPRILYGGSVNEGNVAAIMKEPHVDGMLVGGASLSVETFLNIVKAGANGGSSLQTK